MGILYRILYHIFKTCMWVFYREIKIVGAENVPRKRPVLICGNHANMVMDPLLIALSIPHKRQCHFWAMKELFTPIFGAFLRSVGAVPVDRKTKDNALLYRETFEVLKNNGVMALFPEGTSYTAPSLLQFKDGAARAALEFAAFVWRERGQQNFAQFDYLQTAQIIPVGINYEQKESWRSSVVIEYGQPIDVNDYLEDFIQKDPKAVTKLVTERLYQAIKDLTVNVPDWETLELVHLAQSIFLSGVDDVSSELNIKLSQNLADAYNRTVQIDPNVQALRRDLEQYHGMLWKIGLQDSHILSHQRKAITVTRAFQRVCFSAVRFLMDVPFFAPGLVMHFPVLMLAILMKKRQKYTEQIAQDMFSVILFVIPIYYLLFAGAVWYLLQGSILLALGTLLVLGFCAQMHLHVWDSSNDHWKKLTNNVQLGRIVWTKRGRDDMDRLADIRVSLQRNIFKVVRTYGQTNDNVARFLHQHMTNLQTS